MNLLCSCCSGVWDVTEFAQEVSIIVNGSLHNPSEKSKVSMKAGNQPSVATLKTSHCCLFGLQEGPCAWVCLMATFQTLLPVTPSTATYRKVIEISEQHCMKNLTKAKIERYMLTCQTSFTIYKEPHVQMICQLCENWDRVMVIIPMKFFFSAKHYYMVLKEMAIQYQITNFRYLSTILQSTHITFFKRYVGK